MATRPDNWEAVKALFEAALQENAANRSSFLKERCPDAGLCAEVERLLAEHDEAASFLSTPALGNVPCEAGTRAARLSEGEVLAERFRIIRFIASGGMGEVYEAEDQELREHVALKTVRPEILVQPNAMARFKREVHLARQVTHPNVCRIFDLFRHRAGDLAHGETVFISMELLHGKTLGERLKEGGRMSTEEAEPLVRQMASALAAAHQAGIIHRDFKPGNGVLVVAPGGLRAVVTDFGLALRSVTCDETASLPTGQGLLGTPAYMSPEQIEGRQATTASDIYALGLVIYEMVSGGKPFQGGTPMSEAVKRTFEAPIPPRNFEPRLSAAWESVILRCLEREPARRFQDAESVSAALANEETACSSGGSSRRGISDRIAGVRAQAVRKSTMAAFAIVLVAIAVVVPYLLTHRARKYAVAPVKGRKSIAVLGFKNLSGRPDEAWLSTALSEMLTTELGAGEDLRTIPGENVARMKLDLSLPDSESLAGDTLQKVYHNLGSDLVVLGSYLNVGGQVRVDLRLQDAAEGETVSLLTETTSDQQILDLVNRAGAELRQKCGVAAVTSGQAAEVRASVPANIEATALYAEGLAKLRIFDAPAARNLLEKALVADPDYALAHLALSSAWGDIGNDEKSREEAGRAFELSKKLSREDRLWIEGHYRSVNNEGQRATEIYQSLFHLHPDNLEYGLSLAEMQPSKAALATIALLRGLPAPERDDPRIDLQEGWSAVPDFKKALAATSVATTKARALGARFLIAESLNQEGSLHLLSETDPSAAWEESKQIYSALGDRGGVATTSNNLALLLAHQGKYALALAQWEESLKVFRDLGNESGMIGPLFSISTAEETQNDLQGARAALQEALEIAHHLKANSQEASVLMSLARIAGRQGDLAGANDFVRRSIAIARGKPWGGMDLMQASSWLLQHGDLPGAEARLREAVQKTGKGEDVLVDQEMRLKLNRADLLLAQGNVAEAMRACDSVASASEHLPQIENAQVGIMKAKILLEENRWSEAQHVAEASEHGNNGPIGLVIQSSAFLHQGRVVEAATAIAAAEELSKKSRGSPPDLEVAVARARVAAAQGDVEKARKQLADLIAEATLTGQVYAQLEARLALGEINLKSNDNSETQRYLRIVEEEAHAKGYSLIARKAAAARKRLGATPPPTSPFGY
jgi:tetratricopeptide (TPR) repeat protein/TolB-like protein